METQYSWPFKPSSLPLMISLPIPGPPQCFLVLTRVIALLYFQCLFCFSMCWYFSPVCLQFRLKLMCKQDCAGDSSSRWHWTSFKTWGKNHLQQPLLPFPPSLLCLPSDFSQDPKPPPVQEEGAHSWFLAAKPWGCPWQFQVHLSAVWQLQLVCCLGALEEFSWPGFPASSCS